MPGIRADPRNSRPCLQRSREVRGGRPPPAQPALGSWARGCQPGGQVGEEVTAEQRWDENVWGSF